MAIALVVLIIAATGNTARAADNGNCVTTATTVQASPTNLPATMYAAMTTCNSPPDVLTVARREVNLKATTVSYARVVATPCPTKTGVTAPKVSMNNLAAFEVAPNCPTVNNRGAPQVISQAISNRIAKMP